MPDQITGQPCRFRWNGDDHTNCPRCGGTGVDPVPVGLTIEQMSLQPANLLTVHHEAERRQALERYVFTLEERLSALEEKLLPTTRAMEDQNG